MNEGGHGPPSFSLSLSRGKSDARSGAHFLPLENHIADDQEPKRDQAIASVISAAMNLPNNSASR